MASDEGDAMTIFLSIFISQLFDPVRIVLAIAGAWWALRQAPVGKRLLPLSVCTFGLTALMSFGASVFVATQQEPVIMAIAFAAGLFSTGLLVTLAVFILSKLFKI